MAGTPLGTGGGAFTGGFVLAGTGFGGGINEQVLEVDGGALTGGPRVVGNALTGGPRAGVGAHCKAGGPPVSPSISDPTPNSGSELLLDAALSAAVALPPAFAEAAASRSAAA